MSDSQVKRVLGLSKPHTCTGVYCMQKPISLRKPVQKKGEECPRCYKDALLIEVGMIPKFEPSISLIDWK